MLDSIIQLIDILDKITIVFAFVIMCLTIYGWWQYRKMQQPVSIILLRSGKHWHLVTVPRRMITRQEVLGILGLFDADSRFSIHYTTKPAFLYDIQAVYSGKKNKLVIPIKDTDKFDMTSEV